MRAIFISYRRDDSEGQAGRLFDDLAEHFGRDAVFMDVAGIQAGRDFRRVIDEHVASCGVLLAIIGKNWLEARDANGARRLDDPSDFVRLETASALKRDIPVVPVLVQGAKMPTADKLPEDLRELAFRNGVELTHARWDSDVQVLIEALRPYVKPAGAQAAALPIKPKGRLRGVIGAAVAVLVLSVGGYAWLAHQQREAVREADRLAAAQAAAEQSAAAALADAAAARAEAQRLQREKQAAEAAARAQKAAADAAEQRRQQAERERIAAEQTAAAEKAKAEQRAAELRAGWKTGNFPAPNGGAVLYKIMASGDPACASYNGAACLWGMAADKVEFEKLKPAVCGAEHKARWGVTGYEDPKHWCSLARKSNQLTNAIKVSPSVIELRKNSTLKLGTGQ